MREPDMEGVASHHGPVSCAGGGNIAGEASIGVRIGQALSSEITTLGVPTGLTGREGHAAGRVRRDCWQGASSPARTGPPAARSTSSTTWPAAARPSPTRREASCTTRTTSAA